MKAEIYTVFVAHSAADESVARLMLRFIKDTSADCFVDFEFLRVGQPFHQEILNRIRSSHEMLVILSPSFRVSRWFDHEVGIALGAGLDVYCVLHGISQHELSDCEFVGNCYAVDLNEFETRYIRQLEQRVANSNSKRQASADRIRMFQDQITKAFAR